MYSPHVSGCPSLTCHWFYRQNRLSKNISNNLSLFSDGLHPTLNLGVRLRAGSIHYSAYHRSHLPGFHSLMPVVHSYLISDNVVFLTIADKSYPRKLAFSYLDELSKEFSTTYGPKVETVRKPYAFIGFGALSSSL